MTIRRLTPADASAYREIRLEALQAHPEAFSSSYEEEVERSLAFFEERLRSEQVYTFGSFAEDQLQGTVTLLPESKSKIKHKAHLVAMFVRPAARRSGVGRGLLSAAISQARALGGIERVYLGVTATNVPARRLYEALGFQSYGLDKRGMKIGDRYLDEELMVLELDRVLE
ncbi:GNAT family N-acetyltransferase [Paenibacillus koleovorans]|uniref:GNAT family N-acetyltransferase n=1 Tax=Paenibacillus koleovorans TaxID=121608 RepID=UPI000FD8CB9F|nr:GNAT family N-acetyltransferase [Paenibacillus koleovorans]